MKMNEVYFVDGFQETVAKRNILYAKFTEEMVD